MTGYSIAKEVIRQEVELEFLTRTDVRANIDGGSKLIDSRPDGMSVREALDLMAEARVKLKPSLWGDRFGALMQLMDDDTWADYNLLNTTFVRIADRLASRILAKVEREAASSDKVQAGLVRVANRIIRSAAAAISDFPALVQHVPTDVRGARQWSSRFPCLRSDSGPAEERSSYEQAEFTPIQRRALDRYFAGKLPPLGMCYTFGAVAADVFERYECSTKGHMTFAVAVAEDVLDFAIGLNHL